jgi:hypothetical protein
VLNIIRFFNIYYDIIIIIFYIIILIRMSKRFNYAFQSTAGNIFSTSSNLGIGTTSPGERLSVFGNLQIGGNTQSNYISFYGTNGDNPNGFNHTYIGERIYGGTEKSELLLFKGNDPDSTSGQDRIRLLGGELRFDTYSSVLSGNFEGIGTSGSTKMIITSGGNVGIGTSTPTNILDVSGDPIFDDLELYPNRNSNNSYPVLQLSSNQFTSQTTGTIYSKIATRSWKGSSSGEFANDDVWIQVERQNITNPGNNFTHDAGLVIYTNSNNRDNQPSKRITINENGLIVNSGNLGIGTTSPAYTLDVNGDANVTNLSTGTLSAGTRVTSVNLSGLNVTAGTLSATTLVTSVNLSGLNVTAGTLSATTLITSVNLSGLNVTAGTIRISGKSTFSDQISFPIGKGISLNSSFRTNNGSYALYAATAGNFAIRLVGGSDSGITRPFEIGYFTSDNEESTWNSKISLNTFNGNFNATGSLHTLGSLYVSGGNVGIGTASPTATLDVSGAMNILPTSTKGGLSLSGPIGITRALFDSNIPNTSNFYNVFSGDINYTSFWGHSFQINGGGLGDSVSATQARIPSSSSFTVNTLVSGTVSNLFTIRNSGNVGIGTTSPSGKLSIFGPGGSGTIRIYPDSYRNETSIAFYEGLTTGSAWIAGVGGWSSGTNFVIGNTEPKLSVTTSGNVGIGNTSPNAPLQFATASATRKIVLWDQSNNDHQFYGFGVNNFILRYQVDQTNSDHVFYAGTSSSSSTELMRIEGTGNVGIGIASPTYKLDVLGTLRATGGDITVGTLLASTSISSGSINGTNSTITNLVSTNTSTGTLSATTLVTSVNLSGLNVTAGTLSATTRVTSVNLSGLNVTAGTLSATTRVTSVNLSGLNVTAGTLSATGSNHTIGSVIVSGGNVGIGTANPATILEVYGPEPAATLGTLLLTSNYNYGFPGGENTGVSLVGRGRYAANLLGSLVAYGKIGMYKEGGSNLTDSYMSFFTNRDQDRVNGSSPLLSEKMRINSLGYVGIGTSVPTQPIDVNGWIISRSTANDSSAKSATNAITTGSLIPTPSGSNLYFYWSNAGTAYRITSAGSTYFTGQHGNKPIDSQMDIKTNIEDYVGLIVSSADTGYYSTNPVTGEISTGKEAITISEALPKIKLTTLDQDKAVWGVITNHKNDSFNTDGSFDYDNTTEFGDRLDEYTVRINGIGEGAIWVSNINGNIDNGDYICSSNIGGYGRKQNDDLLHNYTVAKATCSVDFDDSNLSEKFRVRYLTSDGSITTEDQGVYIAAFIGCTYHCS